MSEFVEQGGLKKLFFLIEKNSNVRTEALTIANAIAYPKDGLKVIASDGNFVEILYGLGVKDFCVVFFLSSSLECLFSLPHTTRYCVNDKITFQSLDGCFILLTIISCSESRDSVRRCTNITRCSLLFSFTPLHLRSRPCC